MHFVVAEVENRAPEATLQLKREAAGLKPQEDMKCKLHNCEALQKQWNISNMLIF